MAPPTFLQSSCLEYQHPSLKRQKLKPPKQNKSLYGIYFFHSSGYMEFIQHNFMK